MVHNDFCGHRKCPYKLWDKQKKQEIDRFCRYLPYFGCPKPSIAIAGVKENGLPHKRSARKIWTVFTRTTLSRCLRDVRLQILNGNCYFYLGHGFLPRYTMDRTNRAAIFSLVWHLVHHPGDLHKNRWRVVVTVSSQSGLHTWHGPGPWIGVFAEGCRAMLALRWAKCVCVCVWGLPSILAVQKHSPGFRGSKIHSFVFMNKIFPFFGSVLQNRNRAIAILNLGIVHGVMNSGCYLVKSGQFSAWIKFCQKLKVNKFSIKN